MQQDAKIIVPRSTPDPIQFLLDAGRTVPELAVEWEFKSADTVYRLKRYDYIPPAVTAAKMAETFGPDWTAGDVIDLWLERTSKKAEAV